MQANRNARRLRGAPEGTMRKRKELSHVQGAQRRERPGDLQRVLCDGNEEVDRGHAEHPGEAISVDKEEVLHGVR
eukprot:684570-Heterocapsa_arctica.AAC.1